MLHFLNIFLTVLLFKVIFTPHGALGHDIIQTWIQAVVRKVFHGSTVIKQSVHNH